MGEPDLVRERANNSVAVLNHLLFVTRGRLLFWAYFAQTNNYYLQNPSHNMISHDTLYLLANSLGWLAMLTVVGYHFVAVNGRHMSGGERKN